MNNIMLMKWLGGYCTYILKLKNFKVQYLTHYQQFPIYFYNSPMIVLP